MQNKTETNNIALLKGLKAIVDTSKHGNAKSLNMRKESKYEAPIIKRIPNGETIYVKSLSGKWLAVTYGQMHGYVIAKFVKDSDNYTVNVPKIVKTIAFNTKKACDYAINHSENTKNTLCSNRNKLFGNNTNNDCANFVSQCLCAGGLPMFKNWSYPINGIPEDWHAHSKWKLTYSGCKALLSKNRLIEITNFSEIKAGDIIYSLNTVRDTTKQYTHVTIVVKAYYTHQNKEYCDICGHSSNQNSKAKRLIKNKVKCYRIASPIKIYSDEKIVDLNNKGDGAVVLN